MSSDSPGPPAAPASMPRTAGRPGSIPAWRAAVWGVRAACVASQRASLTGSLPAATSPSWSSRPWPTSSACPSDRLAAARTSKPARRPMPAASMPAAAAQDRRGSLRAGALFGWRRRTALLHRQRKCGPGRGALAGVLPSPADRVSAGSRGSAAASRRPLVRVPAGARLLRLLRPATHERWRLLLRVGQPAPARRRLSRSTLPRTAGRSLRRSCAAGPMAPGVEA
jgi:hypothetical protein